MQIRSNPGTIPGWPLHNMLMSLTTECQYLIYQAGLGEPGIFGDIGTIPGAVLGHRAFLSESMLPGSISARNRTLSEKSGIEPLTTA